MKFSWAFIALSLVVSQALAAPSLDARAANNKNGKNNNSKNNNNTKGNTKGNAGNTGKGNTGNTGGGNTGNAATGTGNDAAAASSGDQHGFNSDPNLSLCIDPKNVMTLNTTGLDDAAIAAGDVASSTSENNYINFCITDGGGKPLTNGLQTTGGSCNQVPMGVIASTDNMPASRFANPLNGDVLPADKEFIIKMKFQKIKLGQFTNAGNTYFGGPQQVDGNGDIIGHSHVTCQILTDGIRGTSPQETKNFAFFLGLRDAGSDGTVTADVTKGLAAGDYRCCTMNTSANHTPAIVAVAQHGFLDDCVYFTTSGDSSLVNNPGGDGSGSTPPKNSLGSSGSGDNGGNNGNDASTASTDSGAAGNTNNAAATGGSATANPPAKANPPATASSGNNGGKTSSNNNNGKASSTGNKNNNNKGQQKGFGGFGGFGGGRGRFRFGRRV